MASQAIYLRAGLRQSRKVKQSFQLPTTDWSKCVLCQKEKNKSCYIDQLSRSATHKGLDMPAESKCNTQGVGYATLVSLLEEFNEIGFLPKNLDLTRMDDSEVIEATLHSHIYYSQMGIIHVDLNTISQN